MTLKAISAVIPITSLAVDVENRLLYSGSGGTLRVRHLVAVEDLNDNEFSSSLFDTHAIYGLKPMKNAGEVKCLAFGGKSVAIVHVSISKRKLSILHLNQENDDWILDCSISRVGDKEIMFLGFAHNFVDALSLDWDTTSNTYCARVLARIHCPEICVLFSLSFAPSTEERTSDLLIASGTAFGKIIVWKAAFDASSSIKTVSTQADSNDRCDSRGATVIHTLLGHKGVVFNIRWTQNEQFIASVSDDRTVRLWDLRPGGDTLAEASCTSSRQLFIGWGHVSRLWDVAFLGSDRLDTMATCSEDGTVKIWDVRECINSATKGKPIEVGGACLATLRGHSSSIWRVVYLPGRDSTKSVCSTSSSAGARVIAREISSGLLISCGNDGSIKAWPISPHLLGSPENTESTAHVLRIPISEPSDEEEGGNNRLAQVSESGDNGRNNDGIGSSQSVSEGTVVQSVSEGTVVQSISEGSYIDTASKSKQKGDHNKKAKKQPATSTTDGSCGANSDDVSIAKNTSSNAAKSRRSNGVCAVRASPDGSWALLVLIDGGVWLIDLSLATTQMPPDAVNTGWTYVASTGKAVTGADALFSVSTATDAVGSCICAHPDGHVSCISFTTRKVLSPTFASTSSSGRNSKGASHHSNEIEATVDSWLAHELRTINVWYVLDRKRGDRGSPLAYAVLSATVKGRCKLWLKGDRAAQGAVVEVSKVTRSQPAAEMVTDREQIATSCLLLSSGNLAVGDSRGGISIFNLATIFDGTSSSQALEPILYISHAHGTDPVLFLSLCGDSAFCSVGHDGYLSIYREDHGSLVNKLNCLPIKTPTMIEIIGSGPDASIYVGGFLGGLFIIWDVRRGYQLMRVEGGSWKRPHHATIYASNSGTEESADTQLPRVVLLCAVPEGKTDTVLHVWDTQPTAASSECVRTEELTLPLHLGTASHGKVSYCGEFLNCGVMRNNSSIEEVDQRPRVVAVGGEDGSLRIFQYSQKTDKMVLLQEAAMPANLSVKAVASSRDSDALQHSLESVLYPRHDAGSGIVVAAGGRLSYSLWKYANAAASPPLSCVLSFECSGTIWPKATQDHRILTANCRMLVRHHIDDSVSPIASPAKVSVPAVQAVPIDSLPAGANVVCVSSQNRLPEAFENQSSTLPPAGSSPATHLEYLIVFGDSRGLATLATYHEVDAHGNVEQIHDREKHRRKGLNIIEEVQVSEFPILSSDVLILTPENTVVGNCSTAGLRSSARYVLGFFGDTTGVVSIWLLKSTILSNGESLKASRLLTQYHAHAMGANGLSAVRLSHSTSSGSTAGSGENIDSKHRWQFFVGSGGDDQSLAVCWGEVTVDYKNAASLELRISFDRADGCSGSAIKGVKVLQDSASQAVYIIAVGYDQRLNIWSPLAQLSSFSATTSMDDKPAYPPPTMQLVHESLDAPSATPIQPKTARMNTKQLRSTSEQTGPDAGEDSGADSEDDGIDNDDRQKHTGDLISSMGDDYVHMILSKRDTILRWCGGRVVHTGDVASVDALWFGRDEEKVLQGAHVRKSTEGKGIQPNELQISADILVVGEGFQIFEVESL